MIPYIDTHLHLDQYKNHKEIYDAIKSSNNYYLCVSNNTDIFTSLNYFYKESNNIRFAIGANPTTLIRDEFNIRDFKSNLIKTRYVGEIGLDFSYKHVKSKELQLFVFENILKTVSNTNKILSIHCNGAEDETYCLLKKYNVGKRSIIHWYSGSLINCKKLSSIGCYFSLNCNMAERPNFKEVVHTMGIDRILVESDGPNTKMSRQYKASTIEDIYNRINSFLEIERFELIVYNNFKRLLSND